MDIKICVAKKNWYPCAVISCLQFNSDITKVIQELIVDLHAANLPQLSIGADLLAAQLQYNDYLKSLDIVRVLMVFFGGVLDPTYGLFNDLWRNWMHSAELFKSKVVSPCRDLRFQTAVYKCLGSQTLKQLGELAQFGQVWAEIVYGV